MQECIFNNNSNALPLFLMVYLAQRKKKIQVFLPHSAVKALAITLRATEPETLSNSLQCKKVAQDKKTAFVFICTVNSFIN